MFPSVHTGCPENGTVHFLVTYALIHQIVPFLGHPVYQLPGLLSGRRRRRCRFFSISATPTHFGKCSQCFLLSPCVRVCVCVSVCLCLSLYVCVLVLHVTTRNKVRLSLSPPSLSLAAVSVLSTPPLYWLTIFCSRHIVLISELFEL